jgi:hypothetical protein
MFLLSLYYQIVNSFFIQLPPRHADRVVISDPLAKATAQAAGLCFDAARESVTSAAAKKSSCVFS